MYFAFLVLMLISVSFEKKPLVLWREGNYTVALETTDCIGLASDSHNLCRAGASAGLTVERAFTMVIH